MAISTELILNASQQDELVAISQSRSLPAGYVFRAKLILMLAEGASFQTIKHKLGTTAPTIVRWKERFLSGTPTYSSWLNQVEIWFAKIQRDVIARGVFTSVADLSRKHMKYIRAYAKTARAFRWTYSDPSRRIKVTE